jgi:hypothetical protein
MGVSLDLSGSGYGQMTDSCGQGNDNSGSTEERGISLTGWATVRSQEGLCSMEFVSHGLGF